MGVPVAFLSMILACTGAGTLGMGLLANVEFNDTLNTFAHNNTVVQNEIEQSGFTLIDLAKHLFVTVPIVIGSWSCLVGTFGMVIFIVNFVGEYKCLFRSCCCWKFGHCFLFLYASTPLLVLLVEGAKWEWQNKVGQIYNEMNDTNSSLCTEVKNWYHWTDLLIKISACDSTALMTLVACAFCVQHSSNKKQPYEPYNPMKTSRRYSNTGVYTSGMAQDAKSASKNFTAPVYLNARDTTMNYHTIQYNGQRPVDSHHATSINEPIRQDQVYDQVYDQSPDSVYDTVYESSRN